MIAGLVIAGLLILFMGGMGLKLFASGEATGRAACMAELKAVDDKLLAQATELSKAAADKVLDFTAGYEAGEAKAKTRTIYVQKKGAQDVSKYPVFQNPVCVLPAESLRNVNTARASFRITADSVIPTESLKNDIPISTTPIPVGIVERRPLGKRP